MDEKEAQKWVEARRQDSAAFTAEDSLKPSTRSASNFMNRCAVKLMDRDKLDGDEWKWQIEG